MEKTPDQPSCTKRRGRPPKTVGSCETERPEGDAGLQGKVNTPENQAVPGQLHSHDSGSRKRGRPPKSASKDVQNDSETNPKDRNNEDFHTSLSTPTSKSRNSRDATPVNSSGRRSSRTPKPVVEIDFVTPTSSRKSLTLRKPGHFEVDTQVQANKYSGNKTSSTHADNNGASNSLASGCDEKEGETGSNFGQIQSEAQQESGFKSDFRRCQMSTHTEKVPDKSKKEELDESPENTKSNAATLREREYPKSSNIEDENDNLECEIEKTGDGTESVYNDVVTNSNKKRRGRPRKQSLHSKSAPQETSMGENENLDCETEKTEDATESVHTDAVTNSNKKRKGRPRKQSLEAKSAPVDTSMVEDKNDNLEYETEKTEDATVPVHHDVVTNSSKKRRGRPRKQSLEAKSAPQDTSMDDNDNWECETEKTEDATESVHNESVKTSTKKKRGRPRKQSLEAKSATVDTSMIEDDNDNWECETEKTEDATESVHNESVKTSTKKKRGRPRKQSLEAKSATVDTSMIEDDNDNLECETEKTADATESVHNESVKTSTKKKRGRPRKQSLEAKSASVDTSMFTTMSPHRTTLARRKMKVEDPEKYEEYLKKTRAQNKKREKAKRKWDEGLYTVSQVEEKKKKEEKKRAQERERYWKNKTERAQQTRKGDDRTPNPSGTNPQKRPRDMTPAEYKRYRTDQRKKQRANLSSQKKTAIMLKRREKRKAEREKKEQERLSAITPESESKRLRQSVYNLNHELFYTEEFVSRMLPHSRYLTKHGPARIMLTTLKQAHSFFLEDNPGKKVGLTLFQTLRPKNIRLMGSVPIDSCLCIYCTNIRNLLTELQTDLTEPTRGTSFVQHLFTAHWQYAQFKACRLNPEEGKRRRLPNQRYAEDDSEDERRSSVDTPRQPQANRGKGRPQRSSKVKNKVYAEDEQDSDREFETNSDTEDDYKDCAVEKRKRGRKRKRVSETSDSDKEQTPKLTKLESNKTPQTGKGKSKKVTIRKCVLCGAEFKDLQTIKRHMMVNHSLLYTADNPEGVSNSYLIVKLLGFIDCQKCGKRFRGGQYYNHHTMWCGREEEMAECEICNRSFKAMWLDQHVRSHRTNEKKLEKEKQEAAERAKKKLEEKGEESEPEEEGAGKKKKRKAAKSALKYLTQTKDADGEGGRGGSDGDSYKDSGNESSDTDGDEGEDEQDSRSDGEAEEDGLEDTAPRPGGRYLAKWKTLFRSLCKEPHKSNLQKLQEFYTNLPQQSMFSDLQPLRDEWKPLNFREKMKYLPDPGRCVDVCTSTKEVQSSEVKGEEAEMTQHTLSFGQTCTVEGNSIGFTGAPIKALEWCPLPSDTSSGQVVAVALDSLDRPGAFNKATAGPGVVQFWSALDADERSSEDGPNQGVSLQCCLAHVAGRVRSMAWCPWRQPEQNQEQHPSSDGCLPRLGLLALACSNGTVQVYSVPQLHSLPAADSQDSSTFSSVLVVKPKSTLSLELNSKPSYCGQCLSVAWQQGGEVRYIAAGYGTGMVVVWDLQNTSPLLRTSKSVIRPLRCFLSHSSPVLSLAFCPQLPNLLASSSMDYTMCLTDVNRPGALQAEKRQVHPSIYRSLCWAGPIYLGLLCGEESLSMSSGCGMQYVGLCQMSMGRKMDAEFLVHNNMASTWDLDFCPHSLIAATCDANGKVKVILVDMVKMSTERANRKNFNTYELMFCPAALVYQTHIDSHKISTQAALSQSKQGHLSVKPESRLSETLSSSNSLETGDIAGDRQKNAQGTNPVPASADTSGETQTNPGFPPNHQVSPVINGNCTAFNIEGCQDNGDSTVSHSSGSKGNEKSHFSENVRTEKQSDTDQAYVSVQNEASGAEISCNQTVPSSKTLHAVKETCDNGISKFTKESDASSPARHFENGHQSQAESGENTLTKASGLDVECEKVGGNQIKGAGTVHFGSFKKAKFEDLTANRRENVEELANPNNQLAYRVRLNPNPEHCAWLASGGQSGLLRLDDLSHILKSHRPDVMKLRAKSKS